MQNIKLCSVKVKCLNCNEPFLRRDKPGRGSSGGRVRPSNVVTCCHRCSIQYTRKMNIKRTKNRYMIRKQKEKKEKENKDANS